MVTRGGGRFAEDPLVIYNKLTQVREAGIESDLGDAARTSAALKEFCSHRTQTKHAHIAHRRKPDQLAKAVLERAGLQVRMSAQIC